MSETFRRLKLVEFQLREFGPHSQTELLELPGMDMSQPGLSRLLASYGFPSRLLPAKLYHINGWRKHWPPNTGALIRLIIWDLATALDKDPTRPETNRILITKLEGWLRHAHKLAGDELEEPDDA
jgi:hypothetical protein